MCACWIFDWLGWMLLSTRLKQMKIKSALCENVVRKIACSAIVWIKVFRSDWRNTNARDKILARADLTVTLC